MSLGPSLGSFAGARVQEADEHVRSLLEFKDGAHEERSSCCSRTRAPESRSERLPSERLPSASAFLMWQGICLKELGDVAGAFGHISSVKQLHPEMPELRRYKQWLTSVSESGAVLPPKEPTEGWAAHKLPKAAEGGLGAGGRTAFEVHATAARATIQEAMNVLLEADDEEGDGEEQ